MGKPGQKKILRYDDDEKSKHGISWKHYCRINCPGGIIFKEGDKLIKMKEDEIWEWYQCMELKNKKFTHLSRAAFCKNNNIDLKKFNNMYWIIFWKSLKDITYYKTYCDFSIEYINSSERNIEQFSKKNNLKRRDLSDCILHLNYMKIINAFKEKNNPKVKNTEMKFIEVQLAPMNNRGSSLASSNQPDLIEKQNDIEIIISKGVKVSISPNIDSMKIIKIIELLKDL